MALQPVRVQSVRRRYQEREREEEEEEEDEEEEGEGGLRETSDRKENQADSTPAPKLGAEDTEIDDVQTWWCCWLLKTLLSLLV